MTLKATWLRRSNVWAVRDAQTIWGHFLTPEQAKTELARWGLTITEWTVRIRAHPYEEAALDPTDPTNLRGL